MYNTQSHNQEGQGVLLHRSEATIDRDIFLPHPGTSPQDPLAAPGRVHARPVRRRRHFFRLEFERELVILRPRLGLFPLLFRRLLCLVRLAAAAAAVVGPRESGIRARGRTVVDAHAEWPRAAGRAR